MKTVLIIEDDRVVAATYRQKFKEAGFRVEVAPDGVEGVKLVSSLRPDAVVLDLLMPRLDGIEVLKFIRSHPELSHIPVVVFSNSYMTNLVESAWRAGADECLMKASTMPKQLLDTVNKIMARNKRQPGAPAPAAAPVRPGVPAPAAAVVDPLGSVIPAQMRAATTPIPAPAAPPPTNIVFDLPPPAAPAPAPAAPAGDRFTVNYEEPASSPLKQSSGTTFLIAGSRLVAEPDTEFHAQIRELFLNTSATRLETIRALAAAFVQAGDDALRAQQLETLFRKIHALAGNAGLAGCTTIAHFATTLEVLLKDLRDQPAWQSASTLNSVARAVEALDGMFASPGELGAPDPPRPTALVVEADAESAHTAAAALEAARITATIAEDPVFAVGTLATTPFDLVVTAIHLQDMTGFELYAQMEAMPQHAQTPVIFITTHDNFASYLLDGLVARQDLIARPYPPIELTLKALARARRSAFQP